MKLLRGIILIAIAAMAIASTLTVGSADEARRVEIVASKFSYSPSEITLKKGQPVVLVLRTSDVTHGLKIEALGVRSEISKGRDTEIAVTPMQVGQFVGKCAHFCGKGHGSMTLQVNVVE
ncbi:MAG: cupredoxin domain-containing protein [Candidatus Acidiferrales bacterium]